MDIFKIILFGIAVVLFDSCKTKVVTVRYEGKLMERYQVDAKTKIRNGFYRVYHSNGKVALEHNYKDGKIDGVEKIFHENGAISGMLRLRDGEYDGHFTYYYLDGTVKQKGYYRDNKITGQLSSYYRNGVLKEVVMMHDNTEDGPYRMYSSNGVLIKEGNYIDIGEDAPVDHGLIYEYDDETMKLMSKKKCDQGYCCSIWERDKGYLKSSSSLCDEILK